jgi:hypothetical protein
MVTKLELAESLTVAQLRELAAAQEVDLAGLSAKGDIAEAVAAGVAKADLEAFVEDEDQPEGAATVADEEQETAPAAAEGGGETIIKRSNPETPTITQIEAAGQEVPVAEPVTVTVGDEEVALDAGDAAQAQQRAASKAASEGAEAHKDPAWSNPDFAGPETAAAEE